MMRTGRIPQLQAVEVAILPMGKTLTMARVRRRRSVVRNEPGKGREQGWEGEKEGEWEGEGEGNGGREGEEEGTQ